jgi:deuterolysin
MLTSALATKVAFEGIRIRLLTSALSADDFVALGAGETKEITVETAALHAINEGGEFDVFAEGLIPFAKVDSTELVGSVPYESNKLSMSIDGAVAATVEKALAKRTVIGSSCTGTKLTAIRTALSNCARLATSAASAASAGTKLTTYFKTTATATRNTIVARLNAVSSDCGGTGSRTTTNCNDPYSGCSSNVLAYTVPSANFITYCPLFFSALPALTSSCHAQDQATTVLHEETHAPGVYSPGTQDNGYGYAAATALSANAALNNADSYALYANGIFFSPFYCQTLSNVQQLSTPTARYKFKTMHNDRIGDVMTTDTTVGLKPLPDWYISIEEPVDIAPLASIEQSLRRKLGC